MEHHFTNIDEYIAGFPKETQRLLQQMRRTIKRYAPGAKEAISYAIPTFKLEGNLVHFAGYKNHIGFYPGGVVKFFDDDLSKYKRAKGSVQFPLDEPLPLDIVRRIVEFRVKQNLEKAALKNKKQKPIPFGDLSAPAQRALQNAGIKTLNQLTKYSEEELLELHGMGPSSIPKLRKSLEENSLSFKK